MNKIRELREKAKMKQSDLGHLLNVKEAAISKYETGKVPLTTDTIIKLSEIFHVSADYILGIEENISDNFQTSFMPRDKNQHPNGYFFFFFECWNECLSRIRNCFQELDISESAFCKEHNINLDEEITIGDLKSIAESLDVSTDFLLGISDSHFVNSLSPRENEMLRSFRLLNKENRNIIIGEATKLLKEQRLESVAADEFLKKTGTDNQGK